MFDKILFYLFIYQTEIKTGILFFIKKVYSNNIFKIWFNKNRCSIPDWVAGVSPLHHFQLIIFILNTRPDAPDGWLGGEEAGWDRRDGAEQSNEK